MTETAWIILLILFSWLCVVTADVNSSKASITSGFSELVSAQISVTIDPLEVVYDQVNQTAHNAYCTLSIHRDNCLNSKIRSNETISWHTRICFKWTCANTVTHVMRVENCWTGSARKPIFLIDKQGCTRERTMMSTPRYENSLLAAYSVGYLSVRLVGADRIRLSCTIRMCHVCHAQCPLTTPPRKCQDSERLSTYLFTRWNNTDELYQRCQPEEYRRRQAKANSSAACSNQLNLIFLIFIFCRFLRL